jgi:hypothetical protein
MRFLSLAVADTRRTLVSTSVSKRFRGNSLAQKKRMAIAFPARRGAGNTYQLGNRDSDFTGILRASVNDLHPAAGSQRLRCVEHFLRVAGN